MADAIQWSWIPKFSISRELAITDDLPSAEGTYGTRDIDALKRPLERASFTAEGLTTEQALEFRAAALEREAAYTASTALGDWVGQIETAEADNIRGSEYWTASLSMLVTEAPL